MTHLINVIYDWSLEQSLCRTRIPFPVFSSKVLLIEMAKHACHDNIALTPWRAKVEIELVILDVLVTSDVSLRVTEQGSSKTVGQLTVLTRPLPRC